jgi:uncharacterized membrane protein YeiH
MGKALVEFQAYAAGTLRALDLLGVFVFALSGSVAGAKKHLDLFGVLVLAFASATAGGILRDLLIGAIPPAAFKDSFYFATSLLAGLLTFFWFPRTRQERRQKMNNLVLLFDAGGLALFAVTGTQKALGYRLDPVMSALVGMLTGIGGGMLRDLLINEIPAVLSSQLYAVAALAGASVVVIGHLLNLPPTALAILGVICCFVLRIVSIHRGWNLPIALPPEQQTEDDSKIQ